MVDAAKKSGLSLIAITDHFPCPMELPPQSWTMKKACLNEYVCNIPQDPDIKVYRGAEVDFLGGFESWTRALLEQVELDYVIGSLHLSFVGLSRDNAKQIPPGLTGFADAYEAYYETLRTMIQSGLFDCVGHLDLIKKNFTADLSLTKSARYKDEVRKTLAHLKDSGMVMEINTQGLLRNEHEIYPAPWIIEEAVKLGIELTVGTDAHAPEQLRLGYEQVEHILRGLNVTSLVYFENRMREHIEI